MVLHLGIIGYSAVLMSEVMSTLSNPTSLEVRHQLLVYSLDLAVSGHADDILSLHRLCPFTRPYAREIIRVLAVHGHYEALKLCFETCGLTVSHHHLHSLFVGALVERRPNSLIKELKFQLCAMGHWYILSRAKREVDLICGNVSSLKTRLAKTERYATAVPSSSVYWAAERQQFPALLVYLNCLMCRIGGSASKGWIDWYACQVKRVIDAIVKHANDLDGTQQHWVRLVVHTKAHARVSRHHPLVERLKSSLHGEVEEKVSVDLIRIDSSRVSCWDEVLSSAIVHCRIRVLDTYAAEVKAVRTACGSIVAAHEWNVIFRRGLAGLLNKVDRSVDPRAFSELMAKLDSISPLTFATLKMCGNPVARRGLLGLMKVCLARFDQIAVNMDTSDDASGAGGDLTHVDDQPDDSEEGEFYDLPAVRKLSQARQLLCNWLIASETADIMELVGHHPACDTDVLCIVLQERVFCQQSLYQAYLRVLSDRGILNDDERVVSAQAKRVNSFKRHKRRRGDSSPMPSRRSKRLRDNKEKPLPKKI